MTAIRNALIVCGLAVALAMTVVWDGFLSYEIFRLSEFVF
jgi:hypothetical protein